MKPQVIDNVNYSDELGNDTSDKGYGNSWKSVFMDFISNMVVETKDYGKIVLGDQLYGAQQLFLDKTCAALDRGRRHIVVLKARQLGISTIALALIDIFWLALHPGMQGALITDTAGNLAKFRVIIAQLLKGLPPELKVKYDTSNRDMLVFSNGSVLDYIVAGTREKGRGKAVTLGTSRAYNLIHATEISNWGDSAGYSSLMAALSEHHPDRLYLLESTARGFNLFHEVWEGAKEDAETQEAIFIGWWAKESYSVDEGSDVFRKFWDGTLNSEEQEKADIVERDYGVKIAPAQWAWYRWKSTKMAAEGAMESEYPFHEKEAFVATGRGFFPVKRVSDDIHRIFTSGIPMYGYTYQFGEQFIETEVISVTTFEEADLKIFELPQDKGYYVMGVDPAYGRDEENDRSVIEIFRCYADKMVQVAEYATTIPETHHLAWVICHLAGNYKNCMINIELTGPGFAVKQELDHLKLMLAQGLFDRNFVMKTGMKDFFNKARYYLYHRPDTMGAGYAYFWKSNSESKQIIFNQFRSAYLQNQLDIKSRLLLKEMQIIVQDGSEIRGSGSNHDDRCSATALAIKAWIEWVRQPLINARMTETESIARENEARKPNQGFVRAIYDHYNSRMLAAQEARSNRSAWGDEGQEYDEDAGFGADYDMSDGDGDDQYD